MGTDEELEAEEQQAVVDKGTIAADVADFFSEEIPEHFKEDLEDFVEESFQLPEVEEEEVDDGTAPKVEKDGDTPEVTDPPPAKGKDDDPPPEPKLDSEGKPIVPAVKDEVTPAPAEGDVDPTVKALQDQVATLLEKVESLQGAAPAAPAAEADGETPTTPASNTLAAAELYDFVGDADLDTILSSKDDFNKFLSNVVNSTINTTTENIYKNLPSAVSSQVTQQNGLKAIVDEFYEANADLLPVRKTVAAVSNEVAGEHPDFTLQQIFEETEIRTRKMLGLKKGEAVVEKPETPAATPPKKPALPGKQGGRSGGGGKKLSVQDRHISDVL